MINLLEIEKKFKNNLDALTLDDIAELKQSLIEESKLHKKSIAEIQSLKIESVIKNSIFEYEEDYLDNENYNESKYLVEIA